MPSAPTTLVARSDRLPRLVLWDAVFVGLTVTHAALLLSGPAAWMIALLLWWNANTISHNFIHRPFFASAQANRRFSLLLSLTLGFPQTIWRDRHLRHHAELDERFRLARGAAPELVAVVALFVLIAAVAPTYFLFAYLPGWACGLGLCWIHGWYEHARGTTSHYGRLYNLIFFNDGYHVEHHARPSAHWTELPGTVNRTLNAEPTTTRSSWPPVLRWLERAWPTRRP